MKICSSCKQSKDLSCFSKKGNSLQSKCKDCQKIYYKKYYESVPKEKERILKKNIDRKNILKKWIAEIKENAKCADCGNSYPACAMDFDHIEDNKDSSVSSMISSLRTKEDIAKEIEKCEIVCANCHRIRTRDRLNAG